MEYYKLIRDRIPEILKNKRKNYKIHTASDEEYREKLLDKLQEEVDEYLSSKNPEELTDILEVVYAIANNHNLSNLELETLRKKKREERGGFGERIILEEVED